MHEHDGPPAEAEPEDTPLFGCISPGCPPEAPPVPTACGDDPDSRREQDKYQRMWQCSEYHQSHAAIAHARQLLTIAAVPPGASVIDFGCGAGHAARFLQTQGYRVLGIDIAGNAVDTLSVGSFAFLRACLWDMPVALRADYGFCVDTLEHIPPAHIDAVLDNIAAAVCHRTLFGISLRPDGCGRLIGETLHLTVQPAPWWLERLARFWSCHEVLEHRPGDWLLVLVWNNTNGPKD